jgi:hypothetical protein
MDSETRIYPGEVLEGLKKVVIDLLGEDDLGAVIRVHIRLEQLIGQFVVNLSPHPEHLKRLKLDYDGLVSLALVLGLKEQWGAPFRALGKLRNDFAHKPDMELTKEAVSNLYKSLGPGDKKRVQNCYIKLRDEYKLAGEAKRYAELSPSDQFKLIGISLWGMAQAMAMVAGREPSAEN